MNYSRWRKMDLHIHSSFSHDSSLTVEQLVTDVIESGIELFSVTDHNTLEAVSEIRQEVARRKSCGIEVTYLPGIELRVERGRHPIHALVIFPEDIQLQEITDRFMGPLRLTETAFIETANRNPWNSTSRDSASLLKRGRELHFVDWDTLVQVKTDVGGWLVLAHPKGNNGAEREIDYRDEIGDTILKDTVRSVDMMEVSPSRAHDDRKFYLNAFGTFDFRPPLPSVLSSDAHEPKGQQATRAIGTRFTWLKADTVGFEALYQTKFEPELRIHVGSSVPSEQHTWVKSVEVDGGYCGGQPISFSPYSNSLIGPRGSGKSAVMDLLRFGLNQYPAEDQQALRRFYDLIRNGNTVKVTVAHGGIDVTLQRTVNIERRLAGSSEIYIDRSEPIAPSFQIEFFSQHELSTIVKKADATLKLVDELGSTGGRRLDIDTMVEELRRNQADLLAEIGRLRPLQSKVDDKRVLEAEIARLEGLLSDNVFMDFRDVDADKQATNALTDTFNSIAGVLSQSKQQVDNLLGIKLASRLPLTDIIDRFRDDIQLLFGEMLKRTAEAVSQIENLEFEERKFSDYYERMLAGYHQKLREKGLENYQDSMEQLATAKRNLTRISTVDEPALLEIVSRIKKLHENRYDLLNRMNNERIALRRERQDECISLNDKDNVLKFECQQEEDIESIKSYVLETLRGSNIRNGERQVETALRNLSGTVLDLARAIGHNTDSGLVSLGFTSDAASKIRTAFSDDVDLGQYGLPMISQKLMDIETMLTEDIIKLYVETNQGRSAFEELSPGEQCSHMLGLLFSANRAPLVVDQPEDDLDYGYVDQLIKDVRRARSDNESRQLIFATHNQNVVVLADFEHVQVMERAIGDQHPLIKVAAEGGLERNTVRAEILKLEGGEAAFRRRAERYRLTQ